MSTEKPKSLYIYIYIHVFLSRMPEIVQTHANPHGTSITVQWFFLYVFVRFLDQNPDCARGSGTDLHIPSEVKKLEVPTPGAWR